MPSIRVGFGSDYVIKNQSIGIGTDNPRATLDVVGSLKGDISVSGVNTLSVYAGFVPEIQNVNENLTLTGEFTTVSEDIVVGAGVTFIVSDGSTFSAGSLESISVQSHFSVPDGGTLERPTDPVEGMVRFNDDLNTLEFWNGFEWRQFTVTGASGRGVFGGGQAPTQISTIDYINISTLGNAINFGNLLTASVPGNGSFASSTRGIFAATSIPGSNVIEYITIASEGNSIDFGDLTQSRFRIGGGLSSSTRGIFGGGRVPTAVNTIDYVTIASIGNALDFGDLTVARRSPGGFSSPTRGIFVGGYIAPTYSNVIDFITISSTGNAVDFGDSIYSGGYGAGCSNSVRGFVLGGYYQDGTTFSKTIGYVTIATTGNALDFGNLTIARPYASAVSSSTRGVCSNGLGSPAHHNVMDYITISTAGNAQDFGDSTIIGFDRGACSDSHGGLGGF
jgi:hypothetical protein